VQPGVIGQKPVGTLRSVAICAASAEVDFAYACFTALSVQKLEILRPLGAPVAVDLDQCAGLQQWR
jgi:hypothetical protein